MIKLNIGAGSVPIPEYVGIDVEPYPSVRWVMNADDLHAWKAGEVDEIYASHILEHLQPGIKALWNSTSEREPGRRERALKEWNRVLKIGGVLIVCVPDAAELGRILCTYPQLHMEALSCLFGGHTNANDMHRYAYTEDTLRELLQRFGFGGFERIAETPGTRIKDASCARVGNMRVSLNMRCTKGLIVE